MKNRLKYIFSNLILIIVLITFMSFQIKSFSQHNHSEYNNIVSLIKKGEQLEKLFPDSAIYYYQKGLDLYSPISKSEDESIVKIKLMLKIGWIFHSQSKYSFASDYYFRALTESEAILHDSLIGESNFSIAEINLENGSYAKAVNSYYAAKEKFRKINYSDGLFWSDIGLGIIFRELGNSIQSQKHYEDAVSRGKKEGKKKYIAISYNNLGNLYRQSGDYEKALEHLMLALKSFEKHGEEKFTSDCLEGIGEIYAEIGNQERAIEYFKKSIEISELLQDQYRLLSKYANIANSFSELGEKETALMYFSKTVELAQSIGDKARLSEVLVLVADFYKTNNDFDSALSNLNRALIISQEVGDTVSIASVHNALSELHFIKKDYDSAYKNAIKAYQISSQKNLMKTLAESSFSISKILEIEEDFKSALYYYKIHKRTKDNLLDLNKLKVVEDTEVKYNVDKIEKQKAKLESDAIEDEKSLKSLGKYLGGLGILFLVSVVIFGVFAYKKHNERRRSSERSIKLKRKIDLLNSEINEKNRELTSKALMISQNNEILKDVVNSIDEYLNGIQKDKNHLKKLKIKLREIYEESSWDDFIQHFEQVHPKFYEVLLTKCNDLTSAEQKVCAFLKMNLNTKEISQITNQSIKAIEVMRSRIRSKLNMSHQESLTKAIQSL